MRKALLLLIVSLIIFTALPAAAVDVKFSGSYYAQGWYVDNPSVLDKGETPGAASWGTVDASAANYATRDARTLRGPNAFYSQRFRLLTEFQVVRIETGYPLRCPGETMGRSGLGGRHR